MTSNNNVAFKPSPDVLAAHLDDETIVLHLGTKQYFHLNATGQRIWKLLEESVSDDNGDVDSEGGADIGISTHSIAQRLCEEFDVDIGTASGEVEGSVKTLLEYALIVEVPDSLIHD